MLSKDKIQAIELLKGLTDEQIQAIEDLSKYDEDKVIGEKTRQFYDNLDNDIKEVTGVVKPDNTKSYEFNKKLLGEYKSKAEKAAEYEATIQQLNVTNAELQEKAKKGITDEQLKAEHEKLKNDFNTLQELATQKESEFTKSRLELEQKQKQFFVDSKINEVVSGLQLKHNDERLNKLVLEDAKNKILSKYVIEVTDDNNVEIRNKDGVLEINKATVKPLSLNDVFTIELAQDLKPEKKGTETKNIPTSYTSYLGDAKNRGEAQTNLRSYLMKDKGLTMDSEEYKTEWANALNGDDYKALPAE